MADCFCYPELGCDMRPRARITDELNQCNVNDYTWEERFEHSEGRAPTVEEVAYRDNLLDRIFGVVRGG